METARRAVMLRALDIVGSREALAERLGVRPVVLDGWLSGGVPVPEAIFLRAVDIVQGSPAAPRSDAESHRKDRPT